jgi:hypothetical protein
MNTVTGTPVLARSGANARCADDSFELVWVETAAEAHRRAFG